MTLGEQVADLQERIRLAQQERMRAEMQAQAAEQAAESAREELHRRYGITTVAQAEDLLQRMRVQLDETIVWLEKALTEVESP